MLKEVSVDTAVADTEAEAADTVTADIAAEEPESADLHSREQEPAVKAVREQAEPEWVPGPVREQGQELQPEQVREPVRERGQELQPEQVPGPEQEPVPVVPVAEYYCCYPFCIPFRENGFLIP